MEWSRVCERIFRTFRVRLPGSRQIELATPELLFHSKPFRSAPESLLDCKMTRDPPIIGIRASPYNFTVVWRIRLCDAGRTSGKI